MPLSLFKRAEREDVRIDLLGINVAFNHRLKICFLYDSDSAMPEDRYHALEQHLNRRGYFLQVIVAAAGSPLPMRQDFEFTDGEQ